MNSFFPPCEWSGTRLHFAAHCIYGICVFVCTQRLSPPLILTIDSWKEIIKDVEWNHKEFIFFFLRFAVPEMKTGTLLLYFLCSWTDCWRTTHTSRHTIPLLYWYVKDGIVRMSGQVLALDRRRRLELSRAISAQQSPLSSSISRGLTGHALAPRWAIRPMNPPFYVPQTSRRRRTAVFSVQST